MLVSQFGHGRLQLPLTADMFSVEPGGSTTQTYTLYFAIQGENPVGCNIPSSLVGPFTVNPGERLVVAVPDTIKAAGEAWTGYSLSAASTNDVAQLVQLARFAALPATIVLEHDEHFKRSQTVNQPANLPTATVPGMRRGVLNNAASQPLGYVYEFRPDSNLPENDFVLEGVLTGQWVRVGGFSRTVTDIEEPGGCGQDIRGVSEAVVEVEPYACDGSNGTARTFWLTNYSGDAIESGQRVMITVSLNEIPRSALFEGLLRVKFLGYVNTLTGALRTTTASSEPFPGVNQEILFENKKSDLLFPDDLEPNEAYALEIYPNFRPEYLNNLIPQGGVVKIFPTIAVQAGAFDESGDSLGDSIFNTYDRGICLPMPGSAVRCLKRSGRVNSRVFRAVAPTIVTGFLNGILNQQVRINGNGVAYRGSGTQESGEAIRAIVDCGTGLSKLSPLSPSVTLSASQGIEVTLNYPTVVRTNYPDRLIPGQAATLNAPFVSVFIVLDDGVTTEIRRFSSLPVIPGATQVFAITDWTNGTVVGSLPSDPSNWFGLFAAVGATAVAAGTGTFPAGDIQVAYAFEYDGTTATRISHDPIDGCIHTATLTLAQIESASAYWVEPATTLAELRSVPSSQRVPWQELKVTAIAEPYFFDPTSYGVDDGTPTALFARPSDIPAEQPGRWTLKRSNRFLVVSDIPTSLTPGIKDDLRIVLKVDDQDPDHGKTYQYDGSTWEFKGVLRGRKGDNGEIIVFEDPPTSLTPGTLNAVAIVLNSDPLDLDNGKVYRYTGSDWVFLGKLGEGAGIVNVPPTVVTSDGFGNFVVDANLNRAFALTLDNAQNCTIDVSNVEDGSYFDIYFSWNNNNPPLSLNYLGGFRWLDGHTPKPDFGVSVGSDAPICRLSCRYMNAFTGLVTDVSPRVPMMPLDPVTVDILDSMTGYYSDAQAQRIDRFVRSLKFAGIWDTIQVLHIYAAPNSTDATYNWIPNFSATLVPGANPFEAWKGFITDDPMEVPAIYEDIQTVGIWSLTSDLLSGVDLGLQQLDATNGNQTTQLQLRNSMNETVGEVQSNPAASASSSSGEGWFAVSREVGSPNDTQHLYVNGIRVASQLTPTVTPVSLPGQNFAIGGIRTIDVDASTNTITDPITRQYSAAVFATTDWTPLQHRIFYDSLREYLSVPRVFGGGGGGGD